MNTPHRRGASARALALATILMLVTAACGGEKSDAASGDAAPVVTEPATTELNSNPHPDREYPLTIQNCGVEVTVDGPPERAVTMNQAATEVMLALGLEDRMVGTAYLDDEIRPDFAAAYATIPVLSDGYPSTEGLFDVEPDFVYGSYVSAFGDEAAGDRESLAALGVASYLSFGGCPDQRESGEALSFDDVFGEIRDLGALFGVSNRAEALIAEHQSAIDSSALDLEDPLSVMWWDGGTDAPTVGVCCGAPGMLMRALGVENLYQDESGSWATINWEQVIADDPDVIVLVDADWDRATDKLAHLKSDPALADLVAVREERLVTIPFSATTPGVRNADALAQLARDIRALQP